MKISMPLVCEPHLIGQNPIQIGKLNALMAASTEPGLGIQPRFELLGEAAVDFRA